MEKIGTEQEILDQLAALVEGTRKLAGEIDEVNAEVDKDADTVVASIDGLIAEVGAEATSIQPELDAVEKIASNELDALILERAEELGND